MIINRHYCLICCDRDFHSETYLLFICSCSCWYWACCVHTKFFFRGFHATRYPQCTIKHDRKKNRRRNPRNTPALSPVPFSCSSSHIISHHKSSFNVLFPMGTSGHEQPALTVSPCLNSMLEPSFCTIPRSTLTTFHPRCGCSLILTTRTPAMGWRWRLGLHVLVRTSRYLCPAMLPFPVRRVGAGRGVMGEAGRMVELGC